MNEIILAITALELDRSGSKASIRELKKILEKYEFDKEFIENINEDTVKGFASAINICKQVVKDKSTDLISLSDISFRCAHHGDCMGDEAKCKTCPDYVCDYAELQSMKRG